MRLNGVEIKANLRDGVAEEAMGELGLDKKQSLRIWFYEDSTHADLLPLLTGGVVIRARDKGDDGGDCTAKLRPCRRSQLTRDWNRTEETEDGAEVKFEEDWSTKGEVLAVSCEVKLGVDALTEVENESGMPDGLLADGQRRLLEDCATVTVNPGTLIRLGPIKATKWKTVAADGLAELKANAERWQVAGMDLLEISVRVDEEDVDDAGQVMQDFLAALKNLDLPLDTSGTNKTERVLNALVSAREGNTEGGNR